MSERRTFLRAFPSSIERTGTRQLTGRLVPYNVAADVLDELPNGELDIYREGFRPGAFGPQALVRERGVLSKIALIHRHEGGLGFLGPFSALREQPDGLYGDVTVLRSKADDVEDLLAAGVDELSVEFRLPRNNHTEIGDDGIRWRTRAHLDQVALEPKGAYRSAQVLAYRAEIDAEQRERAEAAAAAEAQRQAQQRAADAEATALAEETKRAEAEADAAAERRRRWDEMTGRLDGDLERQAQYVRELGVTQPSGYRTG
jgi:HK97 family phage prohead protease